ncbi:MAG: DNA starvation/stationary phase protection protein [Rhodospirillaceae bacterium]|nr:DNA starvation/stationary phase protection protein [Rhodospirillaceae bacterium]
MEIDIGIDKKGRKAIAEGLSHLLADTYVLYLKTHNYHWNVTGPMFQTLHLMFQTQYNELWLAVDMVAERIRTLGEVAPGTYKSFSKLASIKEEEGVPKATDMIKNLVKGHEQAAKTARKIFPLADKVSDEPTADLLTQRLQVHETTAWMLRSLLEDKK